MGKTESTAVNQLIANVQGRPVDQDEQDAGWDDIGFEERTIPTHEPAARKPSKPAIARTTSTGPTAAVPPPMPRARSASGTEIPPMNGSARTSTARVATTIPPIPSAAGNPKATMTGVPAGPRSSTLPPPLGRHSSPGVRVPDGTPAPELVKPGETATAWVAAPVAPMAAQGSIPPTPVATTYPPPPPGDAPLYPPPPSGEASAYPPPPPGDAPLYPPPPATASALPPPPPAMESSMPAPAIEPPQRDSMRPLDQTTDWFLDGSQAIPTLDEADIGTMGVQTKKSPKLGLLIGAAFVCALGGVFVGGYLVYDGAGKKEDPKAAPSLESEAKAAQAAADAPTEFKGVGGRKADPGAAPAAPPADQPVDDPPADPADDEPAANAAAEPAAEPAAQPAVAATAPAPAPAPEFKGVGGRKTEPSEPAPQPVAEPAPAPAPKPVAEPAPAPAPAVADTSDDAPTGPVLVDVLFVSQPAGASVVLVDGTRTIPIGNTPVSASIDASHGYEAVFALEGHKTRIAKLDPKRDRRFEVNLKSGKTKIKHGKAITLPAPVAATPEPRTETKAETKSKSKKDKADKRKAKVASVDFAATAPSPSPSPSPAPSPEPEVVKPAGKGVLMVASKPPCQISIDGKSTGLTTPQRSIELSAGTHKVTLTNAEAGIKKTIAVKITAGKPTKLIQDYTADLK
jgi:hypothetical protein